MGNDGGTIAKRQDLFSLHKPKQKEALEDEQVNVCAISYMPLSDPVVGDYKGFLYRKDKLIEYILASKKLSENQKKGAQAHQIPKRCRRYQSDLEKSPNSVSSDRNGSNQKDTICIFAAMWLSNGL